MASAQFFSQRSSKNAWYFFQDKFGRLWWIKQVYNSQDKYQICFADMYFVILQTDFAVSRVFGGILRDFTDLSEFCGSATPGGYSIYPWVGRCGAAPHILTLFKTNISDFPTLFKTEFRFLIPCLRHLINIRARKNFVVYHPRKDILFKAKIDKSIPWLRQKMINLIPCLRQKSPKTYPGWPPVPIKGVPPPPLPAATD